MEPLAPSASSSYERPGGSAAAYFAGDDLSKARGLLQVLRADGTVTDAFLAPERELAMRMYRHMRFIRIMDERLLALQRQGRIGFYGEARGQEAAVTGSAAALKPGDWIVPALREAGVGLYVGMSLRSYIAQLFGNSNDTTKGRQLPCHPCGKDVNYVVMSSCVSTQVPHAVGIAMAMKIAGDRGKCAIGYMGDGGVSEADVHVALNFAGVYKAPVVLFCQNNQWAISEPIERQTRIPLYQRALGFGFPGVRVDGNDVLATYAVTQAALQRARDGQGPTFVEAYTYRMGAHTTTDDPTRYRLSDDVEHWKLKDPIARVKVYLSRNGLADEAFYADIQQEADELGHHLREGCKALPDPTPMSMFDHVYAEETEELRAQREGFAAYLESFEGSHS